MLRSNLFRASAILVMLVSLLAVVAAPAQAQGWTPRPVTASLKGSGATFPAPLYAAWIEAYKKVNPTVAISYQGVGSGQGQKDFIGYLTDFGGSDAALSASRVQTEAPDALHVPTVMGAVVPTYNLPGVTSLRFSPEALAGIYLGAIRKWNDPRIVADNPGVSLPSTSITVVYRSDGSGTTSIWTDYLSKISADWKAKIGAGNSVKWPVGVGAPGNAGVASTVKNTKGAIGYVELVFALANKLPVPQVKNAAGNYITPSLESTSAAADGITIPANLVVSLTNSPNPQAYPVAGFTYLLVRASTYKDLTKAQALTDFIYWGLTEGTGAATRLGYAPLPGGVRVKAIEQLRKVAVDGQPVFTGEAR
ncbi:MAG: phosphate ABC transporter substrate-binding protein PstS [Chloroflexales bacterium]|nr:phosphate ABC transporter substrate-binding protein PstS [Chloroflexales bacterium]